MQREDSLDVRDAYFMMGEAVVVVYSITDRNTFQTAKETIDRIREIRESDEDPMILIGNKNDLEMSSREVKKKEGEELAKERKVLFIETSCLNGLNVRDGFVLLVKEGIRADYEAVLRNVVGQNQTQMNS